MELPGRGYAVVESLPSLGKGRSCTGLFVTSEEHRDALEEALRERLRVPFSGIVHSRHLSAAATVRVEVSRIDPPGEGELTVEFTGMDLPYDLV
jgi:hypothetical protein